MHQNGQKKAAEIQGDLINLLHLMKPSYYWLQPCFKAFSAVDTWSFSGKRVQKCLKYDVIQV